MTRARTDGTGQPGIQLLSGSGFSARDGAGVHRGFHETGLAQHSQVL